MDTQAIKAAIKQTLESNKREFKQKIDVVVNLKELDLKKTDEQVEFFLQLPHEKGKKVKVCALVGPELKDDAAKCCDHVINAEQFDKFTKEPKLAKKLAEDYDVFIAQMNIMPKVAAAFGRTLGPRGKMPNPKAGCVLAPKGDVAGLVQKLQKTVKVSAKTSLVVQVILGSEEMKIDDVADNVVYFYNQLVHHLPKEKNNVRSFAIKSTMGKPVELKF
jgi:large subunit ribosomal protein L1